MKNYSPLIILTAMIFTLAACTTPTQQHMRAADAHLQQAREKQLAGDWTAALTMAQQAGSEVKLGIDARPVRRGADGKDLDLLPVFTGWEKGAHRELIAALQSQKPERATAAFTATRQVCTACHSMIGKPDLKINAWPGL